MVKKTVSVLLCGIVLAGLAASPFSSSALAPMPPEVAVNHDTRQCAVVMRGDECVDCSLPEGWEILGREGQVECPAGYAQVDLELNCKGIRSLRCCLPGHSGGQGDCLGLALDALLLTTPCLLVVFIAAGVLIFRKQREQRRKRMQETNGDAPGEN